MDLLPVSDVAQLLGVSEQRVRAMLKAGVLEGSRVGGRWLVQPSSLDAAGRRGRPMSARNAWAIIEMAEGSPPSDRSQSDRSRLRSAWKRLQAAPAPVDSARDLLAARARRLRLSGPDPLGLLDDERLAPSGKSDPRSGISAPSFFEAYVREGDLDGVARDHLLVPADGPENVILHVVQSRPPSPMPWLAVVSDLAEAGARERQQAARLWDREMRPR